MKYYTKKEQTPIKKEVNKYEQIVNEEGEIINQDGEADYNMPDNNQEEIEDPGIIELGFEDEAQDAIDFLI